MGDCVVVAGDSTAELSNEEIRSHLNQALRKASKRLES
jgi:RNase P protein component